LKDKLFKDFLTNIEYPNKKESWDIAGVIIGKNAFYKFDTGPFIKTKEGEIGKYGSFDTKADKIVFDIKDKYIIVDVQELHQYLKDKTNKVVQLEDLILKLDWNIVLLK
jgi:hypothetical protein